MRNPFRYFKTSPDNIRLVRLGRGFDFLGYYFGSDAPRHIPNEPSPRIKT